MTRSVDLVIRNDVSEIAIVRDALDQLGSELDVPARALMQLQVALDEIVSNVVKYSWSDGGKHEVLVRIAVNATGVSLDIFDDGQPFDPRAVPEPADPPRPGPTPAAGRGRNSDGQEARGSIWLTSASMDATTQA